MGAELIAIGSFGLSMLGSIWKLYRHLDERLDLLQVDRETLRAEMRMLDYRVSRLEGHQKGDR